MAAARVDYLPVEFKASASPEGDGRTIELIAAVFGNVDLGGDVMVKGAFAGAQKDLISKRGIKLKFGHEVLIGKVLEVKETDAGLWVKARVADHPEYLKYVALVKEGALNQCSFGYRVNPGGAEIKSLNGRTVRLLKSVTTLEVSLVEDPMNTETQVLGVKGEKSLWDVQDGVTGIRAALYALQHGRVSPQEAALMHQLIDIMAANWLAENEEGVAEGEISIQISKLSQTIDAIPGAA